MKPAPSIIGFTTASGLGYGMLIVLALGAITGVIPTTRWFGAVGLVLAMGSVTAGLLSSTFHLGHPERAWRAISQWRSSWLSREGLLALATYVPALLFAAGWIVFETGSGIFALMALLTTVGSIATVYCTGMIYASLPPIKAWYQPLTAPIYVAFALTTGLLAVHTLMILFGLPHFLTGIATLLAMVGTTVLKILYWQQVTGEKSTGPSTASATGLSRSGLVRMLDPPHTQTNYLLDEMGFQVGRKHARSLRLLAGILGLVIPMIAIIISFAINTWLAVVLALLAFVSGMIAVLVERWLFFAEAEHTVMLYYGGRQDPSAGSVASPSPQRVSREVPKTAAAEPRRRRAPPTRRRPTTTPVDEVEGL